MNASKRPSHRSLGSDLAKVAAHVIQPEEHEELPELTDDMLASGRIDKGRRPRASAAAGACLERVEHRDTQGLEVRHVSGDNGQAVQPGRGCNHRVLQQRV